MNKQPHSHDIDVLNGLIETTLDSVDGYHRAAQATECQRFQAAFMWRVSERQLVVGRLQDRVRDLGAEPEDGGSLLAKAHRVFLSIRDRVDEDAIVAEVDHGESFLAGKWQAALGDDELTPETRQLIDGCYESVRRGHEQWRQEHRSASNADASAGGPFQSLASV
jgi:uncharacterized protein (TIGR02284 family)